MGIIVRSSHCYHLRFLPNSTRHFFRDKIALFSTVILFPGYFFLFVFGSLSKGNGDDVDQRKWHSSNQSITSYAKTSERRVYAVLKVFEIDPKIATR